MAQLPPSTEAGAFLYCGPSAIGAWNVMGAKFDWDALPVVAAQFGREDIEVLIRELCVIREFHNRGDG